METPISNDENVVRAGDASANVPDWRTDERWQLAQRIAASHGFQRAGQLRRILEHITRATITQPGVVLREYEIACEVLGRRSDFDPANDNIVRQQMSQLRRRLEQYYTEEGRHEALRLTIPKGSYAPHFEQIVLQDEPVVSETADVAPAVSHESVPRTRGVAVSWPVLFGILTVLVALMVTVWVVRGNARQRADAPEAAAGTANAFVEFLTRTNGRVTIVQPDLSLVLIQNVLNMDISAADYGQPDFLKNHILSAPDALQRDLLLQMNSRRMTSSEEAGVCADLQDEFIARGKIASVRFARDIRARDLGDGNLILIGSRRSDPWVLLFTATNNFQFEAGNPLGSTLYHFANTHPLPGEKALYVPYERQNGKISSYVNVIFGPNLTNSGYVLIINGSDVVANVAAARFLFRGKLSSDIAKLLQQPNLSRFELFLRGSHAENEAEDTFELLAVRSSTN